ncbi:MAG: DUF1566 domain-containing protein [Pseudomonadota bacterium]
MHKNVIHGLFFTCFLGFSLTTNAALVSRLGGLAVYDTTRDITWLADANAGAGSIFDDGFDNFDGKMTWNSAVAWAASLTVGGFNDWRLPITVQPDPGCSTQSGSGDFGTGCTASEMPHLFYSELGGTAGQSILISGDPDLALFSNLAANNYWSGTEYAPSPGGAWQFLFSNGNQATSGKPAGLRAWAVRDGDVAVVPIPASALLLVLPLAILVRRSS